MSTGQSGPELNVTPLIDVLLVLLIIFLIIANQMKPQGEQALVPQPDDQAVPDDPSVPSRTIVIQLAGSSGSRPSIKINGDAVAWEGLHDKLMEIYARRMEKVAFIEAGRDVDFEYIADVIDTAHAVEIDKVGLMPSKP
jgi:biopolymer transport protein ExbD